MIVNFIDRYWKPLTFTTIVLLIFALGILGWNQLTKGSFMARDIELAGGKQIILTCSTKPDLSAAQAALPGYTISLTGNTLLIETSVDANEKEILSKLESVGIVGDSSIRTIGPLLGEVFWKQAQIAIILAFCLMATVVIVLFRSPVPAFAVILAGITDMSVAAATLSLLGVELNMAVLAGLLMLLGYSVDTDVLLTTEMLKTREEELPKRFRRAARTGLTMTGCALATLIVMWLLAGSSVIQQIATVLIIGLLVDIPSTWLTNAGILRWWIGKRGRS